MITKWEGCYNDNWQGDIVPEAFMHPAKFSRGLINRIYQHAKEMGWVKVGDTVIDPFGGCALGGLDAMGMGLNWIGIELEEKFVSLGEQNIELWNRQLRGWHNLGTARIIQGDSRDLRGVIEKADLICSSPPFTDIIKGSGAEAARKRIAEGRYKGKRPDVWTSKNNIAGSTYGNGYGSTPGNLANMKEGDIDCVISSPPFSQCNTFKPSNGIVKAQMACGKWIERGSELMQSYGTSPGQLGSMKEGSVDAVISSPPFEEGGIGHKSRGATEIDIKKGLKMFAEGTYGDNPNNLKNLPTDTFWEASKEIVQGCYGLLKPQGIAIWVLKDYIKAGKRVPFSQNWASLCESVGFEIVCWHQAMLVKEHGVQITLDNEEESIVTERKSFFRRLAEKKGSPRIDWEDIICTKKGDNQ